MGGIWGSVHFSRGRLPSCPLNFEGTPASAAGRTASAGCRGIGSAGGSARQRGSPGLENRAYLPATPARHQAVPAGVLTMSPRVRSLRRDVRGGGGSSSMSVHAAREFSAWVGAAASEAGQGDAPRRDRDDAG
jgi:hypothetical protein